MLGAGQVEIRRYKVLVTPQSKWLTTSRPCIHPYLYHLLFQHIAPKGEGHQALQGGGGGAEEQVLQDHPRGDGVLPVRLHGLPARPHAGHGAGGEARRDQTSRDAPA